MTLEHYDFVAGNTFFNFEFISVGPKGHIPKAVQFTLIDVDNVYNLAFGDVNATTGDIDDFAISDNKDTEKVLATVTAIVYAFLEEHPDAWIYAKGSTMSRTRLYGMGINKYFDIAENDFQILARMNGVWDKYSVGNNYEAYLIKRKL